MMMDWLFFTSAAEPNFMLPALLIYDLTTGGVTTMQVGKDCAAPTVAAVFQALVRAMPSVSQYGMPCMSIDYLFEGQKMDLLPGPRAPRNPLCRSCREFILPA